MLHRPRSCCQMVNTVSRMWLALLRECGGSLRRYAGGSDTGDCSTIDYTNMSSFYYHESTEEQGHVGKYRDR